MQTSPRLVSDQWGIRTLPCSPTSATSDVVAPGNYDRPWLPRLPRCGAVRSSDAVDVASARTPPSAEADGELGTKEIVDSRTDWVELIGFMAGYICKLRIAKESSNNTRSSCQPGKRRQNLVFEIIETANSRSTNPGVLHVLPRPLIGIELR